MTSKEALQFKVLDQVVRLEVTKGHLRWTMTDLARGSGVQRTLIYYYFGKSKTEILKSAMKIIGDEFFGLSDERLALWQRGEVVKSVKLTRELMQKAPHVKQFYFHWRDSKTELADQLKSLERRYSDKIRRLRPNWTSAQAQALFAVFFGLVLVPDLNDEVLEQIVTGLIDKIRA